MLNPIFRKKIQGQKYPGRWGIAEHQIPSIKVLFKTNTKSHMHPSIRLYIREQDTIDKSKKTKSEMIRAWNFAASNKTFACSLQQKAIHNTINTSLKWARVTKIQTLTGTMNQLIIQVSLYTTRVVWVLTGFRRVSSSFECGTFPLWPFVIVGQRARFQKVMGACRGQAPSGPQQIILAEYTGTTNFAPLLTHWGRDKWTPFRRRHYQTHFREWKC